MTVCEKHGYLDLDGGPCHHCQKELGEAEPVTSPLDGLVISKQHEVERLISKFNTFLKYRAESKCISVNGELPPKQLRQMRKIIEQAKHMRL